MLPLQSWSPAKHLSISQLHNVSKKDRRMILAESVKFQQQVAFWIGYNKQEIITRALI